MTSTLRVVLKPFLSGILLLTTAISMAQCPVVIQSIVVEDVTCFGANDGSIAINVSGGFPNYTFQIFNGPLFISSGPQSSTSFTFSGLNSGVSDYQVIVVGENGTGGSCLAAIGLAVINDPAPFDIQITTTDKTCPDINDGTASVVVTGGAPPYTYAWPPFPNTSDNISGLNSGVYNVVVTDDNGCNETVPFTINQEPDWFGQLTPSPVTCPGGSDGAILSSGITGGTPPYTFLWSPGGFSTESLSGIPAGVYTLTVTDAVGCQFIPPSVDVVEPTPIVISENIVDVSCDGLQDGQIDVTVTGGTSPYTYNWSNGAITEDLTGLSGGFYILTVLDDNGCAQTRPITVLDGTTLSIGSLVTNADCGESNGAVNLDVLGGSGSYSYNWQPSGQTTQNITGIPQGIYNVTVTDNTFGCADTLEIFVSNIPGHTVDGVVTDGSSCVAIDGAIDITVTGGSGNFDYLWSHGPISEDVINLAGGAYTVSVTDNVEGCVVNAPFIVTTLSTVIVQVSVVQPSCGDPNGSIILNVGGGTDPYSFQWSNGSTDQNLINVGAGIYQVVITDVNGCTDDFVIVLSDDGTPTVNSVVSNTSCSSTTDGAIALSLSGGVGPFTYSWSNGSSAQSLTGLAAGNYSVNILDAGTGCQTFETFEVLSPLPLSGSANVIGVTCNGDSDGSIELTVDGGTAPYSIVWNPGNVVSQNLSGVPAGSYSVVITDDNACFISGTFTIGQPTPLVITETVQDVSCSGVADGSIDLSVTGGQAGYTYSWLPGGETTQDLSGLAGGTYDVTVTDAAGCAQQGSYTVSEPAALVLNPSSTDATCNGACDGTAGVSPSGGTFPYTYSWTPASGNVPGLTGLCGGNYQVVVTDANGCTDFVEFSVRDNQIQISVTASDVSCNGNCDGAAAANVTGTNPPFAILWVETGGTGLTESGLCPGAYTLQVTDDIGCIIQQTIQIAEPDPILISLDVTDVSCFGGSDGAIDMTVTGGTAPYTYQWFPSGQTTEDINNIPAGDYSVLVTDANGCTASDIVLGGSFAGGALALPDGVGISYSTSVSITGFPAGATVASASDIQDVCLNIEHSYLGDLELRIICPNGQSAILKQYPGGTGTYLGQANDAGANGVPGTGLEYCFSASATFGTMLQENTLGNWITAGNPPSNTMTPGTYTPFQSFNNLIGCPLNGNWTLSVTDNLAIDDGFVFGWNLTFGGTGTNDTTATVNEPAPISVLPIVSNAACGLCDGSIALAVSNGVAPYTYVWNTGSTASSINNLCAGVYQVIVTDANGCTREEFIAVDNINGPTSGNPVVSDASCFGVCDGSVSLTPAGGTAPYTYNWIPGMQSTSSVSGLCAGEYFIQIQDAEGCIYTENVTVDEPAQNQFGQAVVNSACGQCNGAVTLTPISGVAPFTYVWSPAVAGDVASATGLCADAYAVTVTDANGCSEVINAVVSDLPQIGLTVNVTAPTCTGVCDGEASVAVNGGVAPYTYTWSDPSGQTTSLATGLCAGTYAVSVTDANGCIAVESVLVTEPAPLSLSLVIGIDVSCVGSCDGSVNAIASGGTFPYIYLWDDPAGQTTSSATALCDGSYNVVVTDANGCTVSGIGNVGTPPALNAAISSTDVTCNGACDGTATVVPQGGTAPYTYLWNDPVAQTTATASGLCAGNYNVVVTDANNCTVTLPVTISEASALVITFDNVVNLLCDGVCSGEATAVISGGTPPYSIVWNDASAQTGQTATGLCASSYTAIVTDDNGCVQQATVVITSPTGLTSSVTSQVNVSCNGGCDGTATVTATGGTAPYTYQWNDPANQTGPTAVGLCGGIYNVVVTDANNCISTTTVTITAPNALTVFTTRNDPFCFGICDGSATAFASGGTLPYTYQWTDPNGQATVQAVNLCPGTYDVVVTDASGCSAVSTVTILQPLEILANLSVTNANCGQCDGAASVAPTGGVPPYSFQWSGGQTTSSVSGLCPGVYSVAITDQFGCVRNVVVPVNNLNGPTAATVAVSDASCFGSCDGSASVSNVVGGTAPYSYLWVPGGQTTTAVSGLCAGTYSIQVVDDLGCIYTAIATVGQPQAISPNYTSTPSTCGDANGSITLSPNGGDGGPYSFAWSPNVSVTGSASGLAAGIYTVTVTDGAGCDTIVVIPVNNLNGPSVLTSAVNASCFGSCNGSATVTVSGGVAPYSVIWNDPAAQTTLTATGLCEGQYSATVTDANGCVTVAQVVIGSPSEIAISAPLVTDASCPGTCNGAVTIVASGGTLPYSVQWAPSGGNQFTATALCAGTYTATVTDANGCVSTSSVTVDQPDAIIISTSVLDASCFGTCDGEAYASATGGSGGFSYQWNDVNTTVNDTVVGLCAGIYQVVVTDVTGCQDSAQVTVNQPLDITINVTSVGVSCFGDCNGQAIASASGGTGPYTYQWNDPSLTANDTVSNLCPGIYNVIVTDTNGCTGTTSVIIIEPAALQLIGQAVNITCGGQCNGVATVLVQGGTPQYTYLWNDSLQQTGASATGLCAGIYTVIVVDANGCTDSVDVTITEPPVLQATVSAVNPSCGGVCDGQATVNITGGTAPYGILWSNLQTTATLTGMCAGNYSVTVVDANLCTVTVNIILTEPPVLNANITATTQVLCAGSCSGTATVTGSGGTPPYTYQWTNGQTGPTATGLCVGQYSVIITDDIGCTAAISVIINDNGALGATVPIFTAVSCFGDCNGTATAFATGGVGPYQYFWNDPFNQSTQTAVNLCPGNYTVTVVDAQVPACTTQASVIITEPALLTSTASAIDETCGGACNGTATATAAGGTAPYTYQWNDPSNQVVQTAGGLCVGTYTVLITDANGCTSQSSATVLGPPALVSNAVTTPSTCSNVNNGAVNVTVSGGVGAYTYQWSPGGAVTQDLSGIAFGTYVVTITDETGCELVASYSVGTLTNIDANAGSDLMLCVGSSVVLNGSGGGTYSWSPSNTLSNASAANPTANPTVTTTYVLTVSIGNCVDVDSATVTMYEVPTVDAGNDVTIPTGGSVNLNANGAVTGWEYEWAPSATLNNPNVTNPVATPEETTLYYVTVTDENGCNNVDSIVVTVVPGIKFPDGISPNGDGINDFWIIDNIELFQDAIVEIYNRWGQMLWQSAPGYPIPWDGRYKGEDLPVGTYYYVIRSDNFEQPFTGPITIVR